MDSHGKKAGKGPLIQEEVSATLGVSQDQTLFQPVGVDFYNQSLTGDKAIDMGGGKSQCGVYEEKSPTLTCTHQGEPVVVYPMFWDGGQVASTLTANNAGGAQRMPDKDNFNCILEPIAIDRAAFNQGKNAKFDFSIESGGVVQTVIAKGPGAVCYKKPSEACVQETSRESETNM